jgi:hypothetical protein
MKDPTREQSISTESFVNSERGVTVSVETVLLVVLGVALVGGLAATLGGVTDTVLPGPRGQAEITQEGDRAIITINSLANNTEEVTLGGTASLDTSNLDGDFTDTTENPGDAAFDPAAVGSTVVVDNLNQDDIITVTAHASDSSKSNKIAQTTVGPTS